ncbi:MAG: reverse transcriptase domain-containing protein [Elusimicrobiota bacterium]
MENIDTRLFWEKVYHETELYKTAVRLYTNPLFNWRKALTVSTDTRTFYDFARNGLRNIDGIHKRLTNHRFVYRPGLAVRHNFNGKQRNIYIYPWEERLADLLLYRILNKYLDKHFYRGSYAYRVKGYGVDRCQRYIAAALQSSKMPVYVIKRDIQEYFASVDHKILFSILENYIPPGDYLWQLVSERVKFKYFNENGEVTTAEKGIPFGTAIACVLANIYLTGFDRKLSAVPNTKYVRYCDDIIVLSNEPAPAYAAAELFDKCLAELNLVSKPKHTKNVLFTHDNRSDGMFVNSTRIRHLGLEFDINKKTRLSRDKFRKICNIFRYAFRRYKKSFFKFKNMDKRLELAIRIVNNTISRGIRNVAIIDYYLKHVNDEGQLKLLDRWLAEEVLALVLNKGHKKGNFRVISYQTLRKHGLPSFLHRRRLILHGHIDAPFFVWKNSCRIKKYSGAVAKLSSKKVFSPYPEAAAGLTKLSERKVLPVDGRN